MKATVAKRFYFEAAHFIPEHPKCGSMHGHSYVVEVEATGPIQDDGMVVDYSRLKAAVQPLIDGLDHTELNGHFAIPTAEHIAEYILEMVVEKLELVSAVTVWETRDCWARVEK